jgi:UDP-2,3-diacylglucosamine pyrophosphatase LpxH
MKKIDALFISDLHIGSRACNIDKVLELLKMYEYDNLFLVGDIIDGWVLGSTWHWCNSYTKFFKKLFKLANDGTKIWYITGNHDEFIRSFTPIDFYNNIYIADDTVYQSCYIVHGDIWDTSIKCRWLVKLGSYGLELSIILDYILKMISPRWSLANYLRNNINKKSIQLNTFKQAATLSATSVGCTKVLCGHTHIPEISYVDDVLYMNTGDWVQSNSYIICTNGEFQLKYL